MAASGSWSQGSNHGATEDGGTIYGVIHLAQDGESILFTEGGSVVGVYVRGRSTNCVSVLDHQAQSCDGAALSGTGREGASGLSGSPSASVNAAVIPGSAKL